MHVSEVIHYREVHGARLFTGLTVVHGFGGLCTSDHAMHGVGVYRTGHAMNDVRNSYKADHASFCISYTANSAVNDVGFRESQSC